MLPSQLSSNDVTRSLSEFIEFTGSGSEARHDPTKREDAAVGLTLAREELDLLMITNNRTLNWCVTSQASDESYEHLLKFLCAERDEHTSITSVALELSDSFVSKSDVIPFERATVVVDAVHVTQSQLRTVVTSLHNLCSGKYLDCGDVYVITALDDDVTRRMLTSSSARFQLRHLKTTAKSLPRMHSNTVVMTSWRVDVTSHTLRSCQLYTLNSDVIYTFTNVDDVTRAPAVICVNKHLFPVDVVVKSWFQHFSFSTSNVVIENRFKLS